MLSFLCRLLWVKVSGHSWTKNSYALLRASLWGCEGEGGRKSGENSTFTADTLPQPSMRADNTTKSRQRVAKLSCLLM